MSKKYVDLLKQGEKEKEDNLAPARAAEQKGALGLKIAKLKLQIQGKENTVAEASGKYPLDVETIVDALDSLDLDKRLLGQLEGLDTELFGS